MKADRDMTNEAPPAAPVDAVDLHTFPDLAAVDPFGTMDSAADPAASSSGPGASSFGPAISINGSDHNGEAASETDQGEPWPVTRMSYGRHIRVLLVEADPANADAFTRAADESVLDVRVESVPDPDAALGRLERSVGPLLRKPLPDVVVTSLDMPDAHRLLELLHDDSRFDGVPVIVLAAAASSQAERRSFALGAAAHLVAPRRDYERVALVHALPDFIPRARAAHSHLESHRR